MARFSGRSTGITNASGHGNTETRRGRRYRAALVSAEVSLGTLLAIASGLLLLSLRHVMNAPKGFTEDSALIADFTLPPAKYPTVGATERFLD